MLREPGALRRSAPARPPAYSGFRSDENAPRGGAPDAAAAAPPCALAAAEPGSASRPPLRAIQPAAASGVRRRSDWPAVAPSKPPVWTSTKGGSWVRASKTPAPARLGAVAASLPAPAKTARKRPWSLGTSSAAEVNHDFKNVSSTWRQQDSHAATRIQDGADEGLIKNSEDVFEMKLNFDIIKTVLVEEMAARAQAAHLHILEICRQKDAMESELTHERSVKAALEQLMVNNSNLDNHSGMELPYEEPRMHSLKCFSSEDSPLITKLDRLQASLEKARDLNTRYQRDKEQMDEIREQAEVETAKTIISLTEDLAMLQQQSKQSLDKLQLEKNQLNDRLLEEMIKTESLSESKAYAEERYHETLHAISKENTELKDLVASLKSGIISLRKDLDVKDKNLLELEEKVSEMRITWQLAEEMKAYAKERDKVVTLLERSNEDLETTVLALEKERDIIKKEAEQQKSTVDELEAELMNVRQKMLAMTSSVKARSPMEDAVVDSAHSIRHSRDINNEVLSPQEGGGIPQNKESVVMEYFACELMEQSSEQPELYGSYAEEESNGQSLPEQVRPPAAEPVVEIVEESELPPVAPVQDRIPVDYKKAPIDELQRIRNRNHYAEQRTATDRRFWSIEQQDLYTLVYEKAKIADMRCVDWRHVDKIHQFSGVRERCAYLGLEYIMCYCCDWDNELIRQFYSTVHISADKTSMTWMADGRRITTNKRAWEEMFNIPHGLHTEIHSQLFLDKSSLCTAAAERTLDHVSDSDLSPLASIANKILKVTIYPRSGKNAHNWNVLYHIVKQHPFDIIALIFGEIDLLTRDLSRPKDLLYAPYIMGMILRAFRYDGRRESEHCSYKPRNYKRKQSKNVGPSAPAALVAAASLEQEVAAEGHEAHVEAAKDLIQFEAGGPQPGPSFLTPSPAWRLAPSPDSSFF